MESNPWKKTGSRVVYTNPWITVREDDVIRPDGSQGIYGVVETRLATGVVAATDDNQIYLVGQYRYPLDYYSWELPEGGAEEGESPLAAIQRELREEAGLIASHWESLGKEVHLSNCHSSERAYLYLARGLSECEPDPEVTEILQIKKVPLQQAVRMVFAGEITDAMSIMGILFFEQSLRSSGK